MSKPPKGADETFSEPFLALKFLGENFDTAKRNLAAAAKPTPQLADQVQAHGLAMYQWMKDNWDDVYAALAAQHELKAAGISVSVLPDPVASYMTETAGSLGPDHTLET